MTPGPAKQVRDANFAQRESRNQYLGGVTNELFAIWRDHCRHDAKRRVLNCQRPRPIPELPYLLEWSRRMALVSPRGGECFEWLAGSSGLFISHAFSFAARGCLVGMLSLASIQQCSGLTRCTSFRVQSPLGVNMQE